MAVRVLSIRQIAAFPTMSPKGLEFRAFRIGSTWPHNCCPRWGRILIGESEDPHWEGPRPKSFNCGGGGDDDEALGYPSDPRVVLARSPGDRIGDLGIVRDIPGHRHGRGRRRGRLVGNIPVIGWYAGLVSLLCRCQD